MAKRTRRVSSRLAIEATRQSLDVLMVGMSDGLDAFWKQRLTESLALDDGSDRILEAIDFEQSLRLARESVAPVIFFDLMLVNDWGVPKLEQIFDAAGPVSALVGVATEECDNEYARLADQCVLDGYKHGQPSKLAVRSLIESIRDQLYMRGRLGEQHHDLRPLERLRKLNRIGLALTQERDLGKLLQLILRETTQLLDADAGSIYILESTKERVRTHKVLGRVERKSHASAVRVAEGTELGQYNLRFAAARNESKEIPFKEIVFPANLQSIAGYCALKGELVNLPDVYNIDEDAPYTFNPDIVDKKYGYRCVSMLSIPMRNMRDEVVGVIQLINKKKNPTQVLDNPATTPECVLPFGPDDLELALSLGNQAGTAIENVRLYDSINMLFESFVYATVRSIEQRDPSTAGHSARVTRITLGMADIIRNKKDGVYKDVTFSEEEMVELHYASILHDVGKIGVREHILTKAKKLFPFQRDVVEVRTGFIEASIRQRALERIAALNGSTAAAKDAITKECNQAVAQLHEDYQFVMDVNEPGFLTDENLAKLKLVYEREHPVAKGAPARLLTEQEFQSLSTRRGSLSAEERIEIESHVLKSRKFLENIPWSPELANVPAIAGWHHEKMNGKGYPDGIPAMETPLQARIMAVADVFDSLTAADRPYKPAIPLERALEIMQNMAKFGDLDPEVVRLFIDDKVWEKLNLKVTLLKDANEAQRKAT
ncbi:MAG: GAF domain-containing protein [Planctomycetes bacterium]|nr:GAF domain-containing protein [Planctomycetota bacterium]NUQ34078.1 GAF domain-containing protein [Planctomycetaceae bacterium]